VVELRKIKILLVEDDPGWKETVSYFLDREPDLFLVGAAQTKEDAVSLVRMLDIDVVLINAMLNGTGTDSLEAALEINSIKPIKMMMVTFTDQKQLALEAFANGVINFIVKAHEEEIPAAIRAVYGNRSSIHFVAAGIIRQEFVRLKRLELQKSLTAMETSILRFIYGGHTQSEIMSTLHITESTVKKHVNKVIKKLGTQTSREAARKASMKGIL